MKNEILSAGQDLAVFISVRLGSDQRRPISSFNGCLRLQEKKGNQQSSSFAFFCARDPDGESST